MSPAPAKLNPFPGLRPFTQEEDYLFFGREEQTLELLQRLGQNRFVAVVGTSGSGKSSLVRCGLLSELLGGRMLEAGAAWEIAVTHPGGNPLALLTDSLLEADLYDREEEHARENLLATLSRSHFGLVEAVKQANLGEGTNFLLVVDQFEEIFRFHEAGQRQQEVANEFVSLLLEAAAQKEVPIYVVLTMRSDFIGECGQFEGLAEMVNRGEFLIPRLSREQFKRVIEGPIKVAGGKIAPRLLQRLLNDLGQQADQLPCLQHALMRTWDVWATNGDADALDLDDYQRVGKMSQALSLHADEIYESLGSDRERNLCQGIFQALTVEESNSRGIRRPQRLGRLCQILEVPVAELQPIIDLYRQSGVTFLMPSPDVELTEQTIIDISHESLMRVWTRLRQWVEEETQAAGIYHRLSESADLHEQHKAGLYRDPELGIALAWREAKRPNVAWAERYRPGFDVAMRFLETSQQTTVAEEQTREVARQRELQQAQMLAQAEKARAEIEIRAGRRLRVLLAGAAIVAVFAIAASLVAVRSWREADLAKQTAQLSAESAKKAAATATIQEAAAKQARRDSEENLARARGAIDDYLIKISESQLLATSGMQPLRADLLASASQFYEDMLKRDPNNPDLQAGLASAFLRVGLVRFDTGELDESVKMFNRATQFYTSALELQPGNSELRHGLANSWFMLGAVHLRYDEEKTTDYAKRAARIWEQLIKEGAKDPRFYKELARAYNILGIAGSNQESSFLAYQKSLTIRLALIEERPDDAQVIHGLAESFGNIGSVLTDLELGLQMCLRSVDYAERANRLQPQNVEYATDLAGFYSSTAQRLAARGRTPEAFVYYRRELDHIGKFVNANPSVMSGRQLVISAISYLATTAARSEDAAPYAALIREYMILATDFPKKTAGEFLMDAQTQAGGGNYLAMAVKKGVQRQLTQDELAEYKAAQERSMVSLRRAIALGFTSWKSLEELPHLTPVRGLPEFQEMVAALKDKKPADPTAAKTSAATQLTAADLLQLDKDRAISYSSFGVLESAFRRSERARVSLEQAVKLWQRVVAADPGNQENQSELSSAQAKLGSVLWTEGRLAAAAKMFNLRTVLLEQALQQSPDNRTHKVNLSTHHRGMANAFAGYSLWEEAVRHYVDAMHIEKDIPDANSGTDYAEIIAPAMHLLAGDEAAYRAGCEEVLKKFGEGTSGEHTVRIARLYALRPIPADTIPTVIALAEKVRYHWHAYTYALVLYRAGRFDEAASAIEDSRKKKTYDGIPQDQYVLAMAYFRLGQVDRARELLDAINLLTLGSIDAGWHTPGNLLDVDWIVLRREANALIYGEPFSADERLRRVRALVRLEEYEKAEAESQVLLKSAPDSPQGSVLLALSQAKLGRPDAAEQLQSAQRSLALQASRSGAAEFWQTEAETLNVLKRPAEAISALRRAIAAQTLGVLRNTKSIADRRELTELYATLRDTLIAAGQATAAETSLAEADHFLRVFDLSGQSRSIEDLLAVPNQQRPADDLIKLLDQLRAAYDKTLPHDEPIRWELSARLYQRRALLLQTLKRPPREILEANSNARKSFDQLLVVDPLNVDAAGALASLMLSQSTIPWKTLTPTSLTSKEGTVLQVQPNGLILAGGPKPDKEVYTIVGNPELSNITAVRLETIPSRTLNYGGVGRDANGSFYLDEFSVALGQPGKKATQDPVPLKIQDALASYHRVLDDGKESLIQNAIPGKTGNWDIWPRIYQPQEALFELAPGASATARQPLVVQLKFANKETLASFRLSVTDAPNPSQRDQQRIAAIGMADNWVKLGMAYAIEGRNADAARSFAKALRLPENAVALAEAGQLTDEVLDLLQTQHPDWYTAMLPSAANLTAQSGYASVARNLYARLSKLQPENQHWAELTQQLRPGTVALWSFDTGLNGWRNPHECELSVRNGVLTSRRTGIDPYFYSSVRSSAGRHVVVLRYRTANPFTLQLFWTGSASWFNDACRRQYAIPAAVGDWQEISLPFVSSENITELRLDPNTDDLLEIDSIVLRRFNPVESWNEAEGYAIRKALLEDTSPGEDWLEPLIKLHPDDAQLQLALARQLVARSKLALKAGKPAESQDNLKQAASIYSTRLPDTNSNWQTLTPVAVQSQNGSKFELQTDGSILVNEAADADTYTLDFETELKGIKGLRLEALADPRLPNGGPGWAQNYVLSELSLQAGPADQSQPLRNITLRDAVADYSQIDQGNFDISGALDGDLKTGWAINPQTKQSHTAVFEVVGELGDGSPTRLKLRLDQVSEFKKHIIGRVRLSVTNDDATLKSTRVRLDLKGAELAELNTAIANAQLALATVLGRDGHPNESLAAFSEALSLPTNSAVVEQIIQAADALEGTLPKLMERQAENGVFLLELARFYREQGRDALADTTASTARAFFEREMEKQPDNAALAENLADLLLFESAKWNLLQPVKMTSPGGETFTVENDGSIFVSGASPDTSVYTIQVQTDLANLAAIRLETIPDPRLPMGGAGRNENGNFHVGSFRAAFHTTATPDQSTPLEFSSAIADHSPGAGHDAPSMIDDNPETRWDTHPMHLQRHTAAFRLKSTANLQGGFVTVTFDAGRSDWTKHQLGRFRLQATDDPTLFDREKKRLVAMKLNDPWAKLAVLYTMYEDQPALDRLLKAHPSAALGVGQLYAVEQDWEQAILIYNRAITPDTKDPAIFAARAEANQKLEQWDLAIADWTNADLYSIDKNTRYGANFQPPMEQRANIHSQRQQWDLFIQDLTELLKPERFGANAWSYSRRGEAYDALRNWDKALPDYEQAIKHSSPSDLGMFHFYFARHLAARGNWRQAANEMRLCYTQPSDFQNGAWPRSDWWGLCSASLAYAMSGDVQDCKAAATGLYQKFTTADANQGQIRWIIGCSLMHPSMIDDANRPRMLELAGKMDDFWKPRMTAAIYFRSGEYQKAADLFDANEPGNQFWYLAAMNAYRLGDLDKARQLLARGNSWIDEQLGADEFELIPPQNVNWWDWVGEVALQAEAAELILGPIAGEPKKLVLQGQIPEAARAYAVALAAAPDRPAKRRIVAEMAALDRFLPAVYVLNRDWNNAAASISRQVQTNADSVPWMVPAVLWIYGGNSEQHSVICRQMYQRFQKSTEPNDRERFLKVMVLMDHGPELPREAVQSFYAACDVANDGTRIWFLATRAIIECRAKNFTEAHKLLDDVMNNENINLGNNEKALYQSVRALIYAHQKDSLNARNALSELEKTMTQQLNMSWNADGQVSSRSILNGIVIEHDKLIPEVLRREADQLLRSTTDTPNTKAPGN